MDEKVEAKALKLEAEIKQMVDKTFVSNLIKDNKLEFDCKEQHYRARLLSYRERQAANEKRVAKYLELLNMKDEKGDFLYKSEIDLKKLYKERGDDIDTLDNRFKTLEAQKNVLQEKLGQALTENKPDAELTQFKDEIAQITKEQQEFSMKKSQMLEFSVENQLMNFVYTYVAFLTTERQELEQWVKVWNTFDEFEMADNTLINMAIFYSTLLTSSELF